MDPLTDTFIAMRVESATYARLEATAPWGISFQAYQHAKFGLVVNGSCWLSVEGAGQPIALTQGDCYVLPRGNAFSLRDSLHTGTRRYADILNENHAGVIHYGGGGAATTVIGGRFIFDGTNGKPFTDALPALLHFKLNPARTLALQSTLQLLALETAEPAIGSQLMVNRLADILFIQAIRAYIASDARHQTGWLGAVSDYHIGAALRLMHEKTEYPWTLASLARTIGMSRSAFALHFKRLTGETALEYLTRLRIHKASRLLREGDMKLTAVASAIGYHSEAAFSKTFKRLVGVTPGRYRRDDASATDSTCHPA
jgi:AraC-like DNA-binding protein